MPSLSHAHVHYNSIFVGKSGCGMTINAHIILHFIKNKHRSSYI